MYLLGGNQGNAVNIAAYSKDRVIAYRIPKELNTSDSIVYDTKNEKKVYGVSHLIIKS